MSDQRKPYTVTIGGVDHTMLLTEEDAAARGAVPVKELTPKNKAHAPKSK